MRPATGARNSVNSTSSAAWRTVASFAATDACALRNACVALLEHLLGDGAVAREQPAALEVGFGEGQVGLGLGEIGAGLRQRVLERPLVDGEQEIALLDHLAVTEMHLVEIAGDAGADLDRVDGDEPPDIFVEVGQRCAGPASPPSRRAAADRRAAGFGRSRPAPAPRATGQPKAAAEGDRSWGLCCQQIDHVATRHRVPRGLSLTGIGEPAFKTALS